MQQTRHSNKRDEAQKTIETMSWPGVLQCEHLLRDGARRNLCRAWPPWDATGSKSCRSGARRSSSVMQTQKGTDRRCQGLQTHPRRWQPGPWLGLPLAPSDSALLIIIRACHRPSNKGTKLLLKVIKAIIIISLWGFSVILGFSAQIEDSIADIWSSVFQYIAVCCSGQLCCSVLQWYCSVALWLSCKDKGVYCRNMWWILHWDTEGIEPTRKETPISCGLRPWPLGQPCIYDWYRTIPSHVMGSFGTNCIYTVGRVVRVWDHKRSEFPSAWVRFPPYLNAKFINIERCVTVCCSALQKY